MLAGWGGGAGWCAMLTLQLLSLPPCRGAACGNGGHGKHLRVYHILGKPLAGDEVSHITTSSAAKDADIYY